MRASVFLWLCSRALWAPLSTFSTDSEAMRSKRNCEVVKASRAVREEVFFLISFNSFPHAIEILRHRAWKPVRYHQLQSENCFPFSNFFGNLTNSLNLTCWSQKRVWKPKITPTSQLAFKSENLVCLEPQGRWQQHGWQMSHTSDAYLLFHSCNRIKLTVWYS